MMQLIDTHCHLTEQRLLSMIEDVIERGKQVGIQRFLAVGTTATTSRETVALADRFPTVYAAVGMHPTYCHEEQVGDWEQIVQLIGHPKVVALGETGLDLYWKECPLEVQEKSFHRHWDWSRRTSLPVIIHMRECSDVMLKSLEEESVHGPLNGVLHSFSESWEVAERLLQMGLYISFAGMLTYKKADALREVAAKIPLDRILLETDSPYLSPEPHRSKRPNEPALIVHTAQCLAEVRKIPLVDLMEATTRNAYRLFPKLHAAT